MGQVVGDGGADDPATDDDHPRPLRKRAGAGGAVGGCWRAHEPNLSTVESGEDAARARAGAACSQVPSRRMPVRRRCGTRGPTCGRGSRR
jgi:hypothetical protein